MFSRALFRVSYVVMNLVPIYVIVGIGLGILRVPGWIVLLPFFVIGLPAGMYFLSYRCSECRRLVYSASDREDSDERGRFPLPWFDRCPSCGAPL